MPTLRSRSAPAVRVAWPADPLQTQPDWDHRSSGGEEPPMIGQALLNCEIVEKFREGAMSVVGEVVCDPIAGVIRRDLPKRPGTPLEKRGVRPKPRTGDRLG